MEDTLLINKMKTGDMKAFDTIYEKYKERIYKSACLICGNAADGDDISQETWITVFRRIKSLKNPEKFVPWLYQIMKRCAFKRLRTKGEVVSIDNIPEAMDDTVISPLSQVIRRERSNDVSLAIMSLEKRQRTVIVLYYYNEFSIEEIAKIMGTPSGTIKSRLYTARKELSRLLEKENLNE